MTNDVSAIGRKSLDSVGLGSFGTGTIVDDFHRLATLQRLREELKMSVFCTVLKGITTNFVRAAAFPWIAVTKKMKDI